MLSNGVDILLYRREKHSNIDIVDEKTRMMAQQTIVCAENIILNLEEDNE
ncbi:hypothetical protein PFFCH_00283 [Plasmodium falciparum FCH/4]|uniref:Uncharacterized protein n=1 Tax=Plasmodium falciparum FCH/4 TaxID=1036724 RepID=A0A024VVD4_PLAFA|nr:hypothetical protein PFFCH_00283 [Plasmodium falciparum FCH/4]